MSDVSHSTKKPITRKWLIGAVIAFLVPFAVIGALVTNWAYQVGEKDKDRWSHLVQPTPVPPLELMVQTLLWFVGAGLVAGLMGLLLYYIFTRCRSY